MFEIWNIWKLWKSGTSGIQVDLENMDLLDSGFPHDWLVNTGGKAGKSGNPNYRFRPDLENLENLENLEIIGNVFGRTELSGKYGNL